MLIKIKEKMGEIKEKVMVKINGLTKRQKMIIGLGCVGLLLIIVL